MIDLLPYAHAEIDGAPWIEVLDDETDAQIPGVVEAHALEGWIMDRSGELEIKIRLQFRRGTHPWIVEQFLRTIWAPDFKPPGALF